MTLAITLACVVSAGHASEPAQAAQCPTEVKREVFPGEVFVKLGSTTLFVPTRVAYGRDASVGLSIYFDGGDDAGRIQYLDSSGRVFFDHVLSPKELARADSNFPLRVTRATGSVLVRFFAREYDWAYDPYCDLRLEGTVRADPGIAPRLVGEFNEHGWRGYAGSLAFLVKPSYCEWIERGRLRVVVRHHGLKRVLHGGRSCSSGWKQQGQLMPGLRLRSDDPDPVDWGSLPFKAVGKRNWTRTYRIDASWNGTPIGRRWLRVVHRIRPAHRIYANRDEESFYYTCEGGSDDTGHEGLPIRRDPKRGLYCDVPQTPCSEGHVLVNKPGGGGALPRPELCA